MKIGTKVKHNGFVFIRQDDFNPNVPPWAIKLVLDKEDI